VDFVVVGLGVGALAILLGLTIRELGARWWSLQPDVPLSSPEQARRLAIGRVSRAGGSVLSLAGGLILLATVAAIALGLPDRTGAIVVMAVVAVAVLGSVVWGAVYARRYHPRSARRARLPRPAAEPLPDQPPSLAGTIDAAFAGDLPAEDSLTADPQPGASRDAQLSDIVISDDALETTDEAGPEPTLATTDTLRTTGAGAGPAMPGSQPEVLPDASHDETAAADANDPVPNPPPTNVNVAGQDQPAASTVQPAAASEVRPDSPDRTRPDEPPRPTLLTHGQSTAATPAIANPTGGTEVTDQRPPGAPGESTGRIEHQAPAGGAAGPSLAEVAPPPPGHIGPSQRNRAT
jgi:hypothetical protein